MTEVIKSLFFGDSVPYVPRPPPLPKYDPTIDKPRYTYMSATYPYNSPKYTTKPAAWTEIGVVPESDDMPDWRGVVRSKVNALPVLEEEKMRKDPSRYFWFDTPDYADPFKKLGYLLKFSAALGFAGSSTVHYFSKYEKMTIAKFCQLAGAFALPCIFTCMATGVTIVTVANLRGKKDDMWNYFFGSFVGCLILGSYYKNHIIGFRGAFTYIPLVLYLKYNAETNGLLLGKINFRRFYNNTMRPTGEDGIWSGDLQFFKYRGEYGRDVERTGPEHIPVEDRRIFAK